MDILENRDEWYDTYQNSWLRHYQETGEIKWDLYKLPNNKVAPAGKGIDLSQSRLALISSAGGYLAARQEPFDAEHDLGDYTIRRFPVTTAPEQIAFAHTHFDHTAVNADQQVLLPLGHLQELVQEGRIGELAPDVISFMGYQPDAVRVVDETLPAIVAAAKEMQVQAALLVPS
ncbi:MAG: glycine/sarcosine/betaine reductase selenoprotein B family protein [Caldilineaceae bacterium]